MTSMDDALQARRYPSSSMSSLLFMMDKQLSSSKLCLIECEPRQIPLQSECLATLIRIIKGNNAHVGTLLSCVLAWLRNLASVGDDNPASRFCPESVPNLPGHGCLVDPGTRRAQQEALALIHQALELEPDRDSSHERNVLIVGALAPEQVERALEQRAAALRRAYPTFGDGEWLQAYCCCSPPSAMRRPRPGQGPACTVGISARRLPIDPDTLEFDQMTRVARGPGTVLRLA